MFREWRVFSYKGTATDTADHTLKLVSGVSESSTPASDGVKGSDGTQAVYDFVLTGTTEAEAGYTVMIGDTVLGHADMKTTVGDVLKDLNKAVTINDIEYTATYADNKLTLKATEPAAIDADKAPDKDSVTTSSMTITEAKAGTTVAAEEGEAATFTYTFTEAQLGSVVAADDTISIGSDVLATADSTFMSTFADDAKPTLADLLAKVKATENYATVIYNEGVLEATAKDAGAVTSAPALSYGVAETGDKAKMLLLTSFMADFCNPDDVDHNQDNDDDADVAVSLLGTEEPVDSLVSDFVGA